MDRSRVLANRRTKVGGKLLQYYLCGAAITFVVYALVARAVPYFRFDVRLTRMLQGNTHPNVKTTMFFVSWMGFAPQAGIVAGLMSVFLFWRQCRWEAIVGALASAGTYVVNTVTKQLVNRPRPSPALVSHVFNELNDSCFPSGHVSSFTAIGGYLIFLIYRLLKPTPLRAFLIATLALLIGLMGVARIYSGEHWPSDVLASYATGSIWLALTIYIYQWGKQRFSNL